MANPSTNLVHFLKEAEGLRLHAYQCPAGRWTIGYGHTMGVRPGMCITTHDAINYLNADIESVATAVRYYLPNLTIGQMDAVCEFCFNLGFRRFLSSTLFGKIQKSAPTKDICDEFKKWVFMSQGTKKVVSAALTKRRKWDCERWLAGDKL